MTEINYLSVLSYMAGAFGALIIAFDSLFQRSHILYQISRSLWDSNPFLFESLIGKKFDDAVGFLLILAGAVIGIVSSFGLSVSFEIFIVWIFVVFSLLVVYRVVRSRLIRAEVKRIENQRPSLFGLPSTGAAGPVLTLLLAILGLWYVATVALNAPFQRDIYARAGQTDVPFTQLVADTMMQERPVMPSPQQVAVEIWDTTVNKRITSNRSLFYHTGITLSSTLTGFALGTLLGIVLAVLVVHSRVLDKSLMPWVISSQTIPVLAIAPMIIVVLNSVGISGLLPKALISTYLSFFPVTVGMVKGLRSPEVIHMDLMHTYSATKLDTFWKLRLPYAVPYLFTSMKVGIAASLVGAIVGELPTGAVAGLGARLLAGSYYGQTVQIWSALIMAAVLAGLLVSLIGLAEKITLRRMGMSR